MPSTQKGSNAIEQLVRLYELRQTKARLAYQRQQWSLRKIKEKYDSRCQHCEALLQQRESLAALANVQHNLTNVRMQKDIQLRIRWLKYDAEKAEFIGNSIRAELQEQEKATQLSKAKWTALQRKCEKYQEQLHDLAAQSANRNDLQQEWELEEIASMQISGEHSHA